MRLPPPPPLVAAPPPDTTLGRRLLQASPMLAGGAMTRMPWLPMTRSPSSTPTTSGAAPALLPEGLLLRHGTGPASGGPSTAVLQGLPGAWRVPEGARPQGGCGAHVPAGADSCRSAARGRGGAAGCLGGDDPRQLPTSHPVAASNPCVPHLLNGCCLAGLAAWGPCRPSSSRRRACKASWRRRRARWCSCQGSCQTTAWSERGGAAARGAARQRPGVHDISYIRHPRPAAAELGWDARTSVWICLGPHDCPTATCTHHVSMSNRGISPAQVVSMPLPGCKQKYAALQPAASRPMRACHRIHPPRTGKRRHRAPASSNQLRQFVTPKCFTDTQIGVSALARSITHQCLGREGSPLGSESSCKSCCTIVGARPA